MARASPGPRTAGRGVRVMSTRPGPAWGMIATAATIAVFCLAVIGYAAVKASHGGAGDGKLAGRIAAQRAERPDPNIPGVVSRQFTGARHRGGTIHYAEHPPFGGVHNPVWADCMGTFYPAPIAAENAVHTLEHGAIWITYRPGLPAEQVTTLTRLVAGVPYMLMSPYPGLDRPVSLQAWGHQLKLENADDPRLARFVDGYRQNPRYTPELGGSCSNPEFKRHPKGPTT